MKAPENTKYLLFGGTFLLANKLQAAGDKLVKGLPVKQWFFLRNAMELPQDPPPTITLIAQSMNSTRQNAAKMLETLEREGYVETEPGQQDRRSRSVRITQQGFQSMKETTENAQDFLERLYEGIGREDREIAGKVLIQMVHNLDKMQQEDRPESAEGVN